MTVNDTEERGKKCGKKLVPPDCPQKDTSEADGQAELSAPGSYNRQYQDRLFKAIFGREEHKHWLLSLYNALNGSSYTDPSAIEINTIEGIIYVTMKNDISFLIDSQLNLYEQQSSYNPNMPLRGLMYFAELYQKHLTRQDRDLFTTATVKIPTPNFVVFYNGSRRMPGVTKLRLSDAFEVPPETAGDFEWTATMLNINSGYNKTLFQKCKPLYHYSCYVDRVKKNVRSGMTKEKAVSEAVNFAIQNDFLDGYFKLQKAEVLNMSLTEFDQEAYDRHRFNEGKEVGIAEGIEKGLAEGRRDNALQNARNFKYKNIPVDIIAECTGLTIEQVNAL
ncbi:hypothetical protein [Treponema sp.]|uniref:hypothetical protein n=2 Tax=Treponema TaxID=157 RepID=UPI002355CA90|nr:hypothetical protein [Treponema sp.]MCI5644467.1 hypothetical protein [Treponema porcinum]